MARSFKIDKKKVDPAARHIRGGKHHVDYWLYKAKEGRVTMPEGKPGTHHESACFGSLTQHCTGSDYNRILYVMYDDEDNVKLSLKEKREYVKMCRKHKLLPHYFKYDWVGEDKSKIVLNLNRISPSLLFGYLCVFRHIREDPGFVRAVVYLVNTKKMNFYIAYVLASKVCLSFGLHSALDYVRGYMKQHDPNETNITINRAVALYRYFTNPRKYDKRTVGKSRAGFNCDSNIRKTCKVPNHVTIKAAHALRNNMEKVIENSCDKEIGQEVGRITGNGQNQG